MWLRSNLLSYLLCRADAVMASAAQQSQVFPKRVFKDLRDFKENRVGTAGGSAVSDERSAAITSFPKKVFKDLRDFKKVRFSRF